MQTIIVIILCTVAVAAYVIHCVRKDRRVEREHWATSTVFSPGPQIREMTAVRPNPTRTRRSAFVPLDPDDFNHVPTDYGTYTPTAVSGCTEAPMHDTFNSGHHDVCSSHDSSYDGGFDGGGHHGH